MLGILIFLPLGVEYIPAGERTTKPEFIGSCRNAFQAWRLWKGSGRVCPEGKGPVVCERRLRGWNQSKDLNSDQGPPVDRGRRRQNPDKGKGTA